MAEKTNSGKAARAGTALKSKSGLKLEVIGLGESTGPQKNVETVRVRRLADGGVRDLLRSELEAANGPKAVASALEVVAKIDAAKAAEKQTEENPSASEQQSSPPTE